MRRKETQRDAMRRNETERDAKRRKEEVKLVIAPAVCVVIARESAKPARSSK